MRTPRLLPLALLAISGFAGPISGGPCIDGTVTQYFALGLAGCNATVGPYALNVTLDGILEGTNTNGASWPADLSGIDVHPSFTLLPGGWSEDFQLSFESGPWIGMVGQSLQFAVSFHDGNEPAGDNGSKSDYNGRVRR